MAFQFSTLCKENKPFMRTDVTCSKVWSGNWRVIFKRQLSPSLSLGEFKKQLHILICNCSALKTAQNCAKISNGILTKGLQTEQKTKEKWLCKHMSQTAITCIYICLDIFVIFVQLSWTNVINFYPCVGLKHYRNATNAKTAKRTKGIITFSWYICSWFK